MKLYRASLFILLAVISAGFMAPRVAAQMSNGSISGTIIDPQGAVIADANITATNLATAKDFTTVSDKEGSFRLNLLPNGTYKLEISKPGFRKLALDKVTVNVAADEGLGQLKLQLGEATTTVEVSSAPPTIDSTQAQISTSLGTQTLTTFPGILENQGLDNLALSVPGVVNGRDVAFSNTNGPQFAVNGLRGRSNDQQIDGQNNNDNSVTGPSLQVSDPEFVSEYQVTTSNFGAEFGRNAGSVINVVTKSGSNNYHGSAYATDQNQRWNTLSTNQKAFEGLTSVPIINDLFAGGTLGGPVIKDKLFFFGGGDTEITNQGSVYSTGFLTPTPAGVAALAACLPNSTSVQALKTYGPFAVKGGNPIPQGAISTISVPCTTGPNATIDESGVQRTLPTDGRVYNYVVRVDFQTKKDQLYGRYIHQKNTAYNADPSSALSAAAAGYPYNVPAVAQDVGVSWTHTFSTRMSNEARFSWGKEDVTFGSNSLGNTIPPPSEVGSAISNIIFNSSSLLTFGPLTNLPSGRTVTTWQAQDNWTYVVGRHSLKAGVNFTYQKSPNTFLPNYNGQFRFADYGGLAENVPNRIRIASGTPLLNFSEKDTFLYFGDDFKVTRNLTFNLGLTWSYYGQPANLFHTNTVKSQTGPDPLWDPSLPLSVTTFPSIPAPCCSFGPNFGFAWSPGPNWLTGGGGKTVIRGGYRMAYDPPFYNIYLNISSASPQVLLNTLGSTISKTLPLPANPIGTNVRTLLAPFLTTGVFDPRNFNETSITPKFGPDRVQQWSLGVQQQLTKAGAVEVRYLGNVGQNLFQSINGNPYIAGLADLYPSLVPAGMTPCPAASAAIPLAVGRANCNEGIVRERTNSGYSNYNALQFEARLTQLWNQLTLKSAYTFSKTLDNTTEIFATGAGGNTNAFAQSQVNYKGAEYGISGINFPQNWYLTVVEQFPFYRSQNGFVGHALGGWAVSGVYTLSSGQPYTPSQSSLNCNSGGGACGGISPNPYDSAFNLAFVGADGALRPYYGSPNAPAQQVGSFAGDICSATTVGGYLCGNPAFTPTTLVSLNTFNNGATGTTTDSMGNIIADPTHPATVVTKGQVRFIANGATSNAVFGTPFGNVGRNVLSDFHTNIANITIFKTTNITEKVKFQFHADFINVFNHPNYASIDPFIDDAGLVSEFTGFANPYVQNGGNTINPSAGNRSIRFGVKLFF
jgi:hypothetical protein